MLSTVNLSVYPWTVAIQQLRTEGFFILVSLQIFQVMLSMFMGPFSLYLSLVYWIYPLNDYVGDTGCYLIIYVRDIGNFIIQLHSFFVAAFRYVCLFHDNFLKKFNLSPKVSNNFKNKEHFFDRPYSKNGGF